MTQYAFYFDSSACSGCKTCQVACKDKHGLEVGRLWRRVYQVDGGDWLKGSDAWLPRIFAYNLSLSCNHCTKPVCAEVCPAGAIYKREDGIVLINEKKCIGCRYCSWACPYGAPQYDKSKGYMTKCTFCVENIDAALPPACVTACPMRALDFGDLLELEARYGRAENIFPLPQAILTGPALVINPHKDTWRSAKETAWIANREETHGSMRALHLVRNDPCAVPGAGFTAEDNG